MGETGRLSTLVGILADAVYRQGRYDEADGLPELSKRVTVPDDLASQMLWRSVRAKIAARRGDFDVAQALAQEAAALADSTEAACIGTYAWTSPRCSAWPVGERRPPWR
jgi:hypothetical protein